MRVLSYPPLYYVIIKSKKNHAFTAMQTKHIYYTKPFIKGSGYLYGPIQISAWFILLLLHANPDPESVTKYQNKQSPYLHGSIRIATSFIKTEFTII